MELVPVTAARATNLLAGFPGHEQHDGRFQATSQQFGPPGSEFITMMEEESKRKDTDKLSKELKTNGFAAATQHQHRRQQLLQCQVTQEVPKNVAAAERAVEVYWEVQVVLVC